MARYDNTLIRQDKNRERYLSTQKLPIIPKLDTDILIIGKMGQTLTSLANQYYGDVNLWWVIARANPECFDGGINVKIGTEYRIPSDLSVIGVEIVSGGGSLGSSTGGY
mgnify:CR=1 FL=1|tara:strand:- start:187 stop:513 length:327 start_codon:yes stop_codon:yes gene_type:complete